MKEKINEVGIKLGEKFGRWEVINENLIPHSDRKQIQVKCECGTTALVRSDYLKLGKSTGCKHCINDNNYPTTRKSRVKYYKGLRETFINKIKSKDNLIRGKKEIDFSITIEDLYNQLKKQNFKCALSGVNLIILNTKSNLEVNASLDRIDSTKGYTINNIQWVHKWVNIMKNSFSQKDFISICNAVAYTHQIHDNSEPSWVNACIISNPEGATTKE